MYGVVNAVMEEGHTIETLYEESPAGVQASTDMSDKLRKYTRMYFQSQDEVCHKGLRGKGRGRWDLQGLGGGGVVWCGVCLLYTSPSPRD